MGTDISIHLTSVSKEFCIIIGSLGWNSQMKLHFIEHFILTTVGVMILPNVNIKTVSLEYAHSQCERSRHLQVHGTAEMKHFDSYSWYGKVLLVIGSYVTKDTSGDKVDRSLSFFLDRAQRNPQGWWFSEASVGLEMPLT